MSALIHATYDDGLATLTLNNPDRGNPIDGRFGSELKRLVRELSRRARLRAVLLRAEGANFSVGGDLKVFAGHLDKLPELVEGWTADLHPALQSFWALPVPIVCAVQGYAMGGGLSLAAGCDVVMAGGSAKLGSAFAQIGFSCDSGSSVTLSARMGSARARRFVLLGQILSSAEALAAGLVDEVVADEQLQGAAAELAGRLAGGPTRAYAEIKRLFQATADEMLEARMKEEAAALVSVASTRDAREGIACRIGKRLPSFQGG